MGKFSLVEFAEFEAIAIGAGEYGSALGSAKTVGQYEKMKLEEKKAQDKSKLKRM